MEGFMSDQMIHLSFSMKDIFELVPGIVKNAIRLSPAASKLAEAFKEVEAGIVFQCDDHAYGLVFKGSDVSVADGNLTCPLVKIIMTMEDLQNIIRVKNAAVFLDRNMEPVSVNTNKSMAMFNTVTSLKGKFTTTLTQDDGSVSRIHFIFNGVETPQSEISLEMESLANILTKKDNAVNLFMSGQLQIEGDMTLAMKIQAMF